MADTQTTINIKEPEQVISEKKMMNPFGENSSLIDLKNSKRPKWINISGQGKVGKTLTAVEIAKNIRTLYFDTDTLGSTSAYEGYFVRCKTWVEFSMRLNTLKNDIRKQPVKPKIIVIDTLDGLQDMCLDAVVSRCKTTKLLDAEVEMTGGVKGNGFTLLHSDMIGVISDLLSMCDLLITITHLKLTALGKNEKEKVMASINLMGSFKAYVQQSVDTSLFFIKKTSARGQTFIEISQDIKEDLIISEGFGGRPFQGLKDCKTADELVEWIVSTFKD